MAGQVVLITGAAGNLGGKLRKHLEGHYPLRLLDREARGGPDDVAADLSGWDAAWFGQFNGVDTVFDLASDTTAQHGCANLLGPNVAAVAHVNPATARAG